MTQGHPDVNPIAVELDHALRFTRRTLYSVVEIDQPSVAVVLLGSTRARSAALRNTA